MNFTVKLKSLYYTLGFKNTFAIVLALSLTSFFIGFIFTSLYESKSQNLIYQGQSGTVGLANHFKVFIMPHVEQINTSAVLVEEIMANSEPEKVNENILNYFKRETQIFTKVVDSSFTGIYGYFGGELLDGTGWVPPDDYIPTQRPWYLNAIAYPGKVVFVEPYLDAMTGNIMMSLAVSMPDGKSVIASDISLDRVQKRLVEESRKNFCVQMIFDADGLIISHTDINEVGKRYGVGDNSALSSYLVNKVIAGDKLRGLIDFDGKNFVAYSQEIEGGWYVATIIESEHFFDSLNYIFVVSVVSILIVVIAVLVTLWRMTDKQIKISRLNENLKSVAGIYDSLIDIAIDRDLFVQVEKINKTQLGGDATVMDDVKSDAQNVLKARLVGSVENIYRRVMADFLNFSTLEQRLKDKKGSTIEYLTIDNVWFRARFIPIETTSDAHLVKVMLLIENIDDEKRRRDKLVYLSETDPLTGICNRRSGESKINQLLLDNQYGMFLVVDIDKFKSFNDTFGHEVGDKVITAVADCLKDTFRNRDVVLRLGGDEFAVYAQDILDRQVALIVINRFFECIGNVKIDELKGKKIHVSVGVAFFSQFNTVTFGELYRMADGGTYASKKYEGNYVSFASESVSPSD